MKTKLIFLVLLVLFFTGCASTNWDSRVGSYTNDQAILEYGPPDNKSQLSDGQVVYSWTTAHGLNWTDKLIMTFSQNGRLISAKEKRL